MGVFKYLSAHQAGVYRLIALFALNSLISLPSLSFEASFFLSISHYCTFLAMSSPACAEDRAVECQESGREKDRQGSGQTGPAPSRTTDHRAEDRGPGQGLQTGEVGKPRTFHRGSEGSGGLEPLPSAVWASRPRTTS